MKAFEFDAEKYEKASRHQKEWGASLIEELCLKGTETVLDLGCGDGGLTEQLAKSVPEGRVLGIDASEGMIAAAEKRSHGNLRFELLDINAMEFENEFDVMFSNAALHWVKDHRNLLKKALRGLREKGVLVWDFAGDGNCGNFFEVIRETMESEAYREYFIGFEWPWYMPAKEDYEKLVREAGFSFWEVTQVNRDRFFASRDEMIKWIDQPSIVPFLREVPEEKKAGFRETVIERMLKKTLQPDGTCFETFRRIHVKAGR